MAARKSAVTVSESPLASTQSLVPKLASVGQSAKRLGGLSRNVGKLCRICSARGSPFFLSHIHSGLNQQDPVSWDVSWARSVQCVDGRLWFSASCLVSCPGLAVGCSHHFWSSTQFSASEWCLGISVGGDDDKEEMVFADSFYCMSWNVSFTDDGLCPVLQTLCYCMSWNVFFRDDGLRPVLQTLCYCRSWNVSFGGDGLRPVLQTLCYWINQNVSFRGGLHSVQETLCYWMNWNVSFRGDGLCPVLWRGEEFCIQQSQEPGDEDDQWTVPSSAQNSWGWYSEIFLNFIDPLL